MAYRSDEVAARAELLRDLRSDDTADVLAYCARVLEALERRGLAKQHGVEATAPTGSLESQKVALIQATLDRLGGNQTHAARELGLSPRTLNRYVEVYRLTARRRTES